MADPTVSERKGLIEGGILNLESDGYTRQAEAIRWLRDEWARLTAVPSGVIELPQSVTEEELEAFRRGFEAAGARYMPIRRAPADPETPSDQQAGSGESQHE